jgi:outer membrane biosynthesis protein TonB
MKTIIVLALAGLAAGCMTTRAQTPIERPALVVPPPPPRVVETAPIPEPQAELVPDLPAEKVSSPPPKPRPSSPRELKETAKPEPPKPEAAPPAEPPAQPPAPLRTPATADAATAERRVRDIIQRTQAILNNVDYTRLPAPRQSAYEQAKDSMEGAEAALRDKAFDLARQMADKAEKLARELQNR